MEDRKYNVEDVYKTTGFPEITYVQPKEYLELMVAMRTKGKCVVIEGPSGIGKTTAVQRALKDLAVEQEYEILSARKQNDINKIRNIARGKFDNIVIIDDFHRLEPQVREQISNVMKYMADDSEEKRKIVVIGINNVGDSLVHFSPDLNNRISTIRFETNTDEKVGELIEKGEMALNISFDRHDSIVKNAHGSFHIAQLMCQKACIEQEVISTCKEHKKIHFSYPAVQSQMREEFGRSFFKIAREFAIGNRLRREGRAPYLHVLKWLSESESWSLNLTNAIQQHPNQKAGVGQIVEKGFLEDFLRKHKNVSEYIHYDGISRILSVEDPKFMFYLKTINWNNFARDIGYIQLVENPKYDYALSFAGQDRDFVESIFKKLEAEEVAVFYDKNEQAEILSRNVEEYLYPIYNSEAAYVVVFLSRHYPERIWARFESNAFKERFGKDSVIPIWFESAGDNAFDITKDYGGITYHDQDMENQEREINNIVSVLLERIKLYRIG